MGRKSRAGDVEEGLEAETIPRSAKKGGGASESGKKAKRSESPGKATPSKEREAGGVSSGKTPSKSDSKKKGKGGDSGQQQPSTPGGAAGSSGEESKGKKRKSSMGAVDVAEAEQKEPTKVHMARFLSHQPSGISAMAHDPIGQRLAVARSNGDIQIWNTSLPRWHPVGVCGGSTLSQVRAVCWSRHMAEDCPGGARLFSASLDGTIIEWSLGTLMPKHVCDTHGGSAWCMSVSPNGQQLAVGCHDGMCRLFNVTDDYGPMFHKSLPPHPGHVLSVAWHPEGSAVVTGDGASRVRIYNIATMTCTHTVSIGVDVGDGGKASMVWAVNILADYTVFAGDSKGKCHVIDGRAGVAIRDFSAHHGGDILSIAADDNEVFSAGIDSRVVQYRRIRDKETGLHSWVITSSSRFHTHDVRAVCVAGLFCAPASAGNGGGKPGFVLPTDPTHPQSRAALKASIDRTKMKRCLVGGGVDTQLCVFTFDRAGDKVPGGGSGDSAPQGLTPAHRLPPWPHSRSVRLSGVVKGSEGESEIRMVCWQGTEVDVWRWPVNASGQVKEPRYAVKINAWTEENLRCAGISPCGTWVVLSHSSRLTVFRLSEDEEDGTLDVSKEQLPPKLASWACNEVSFTPRGGKAAMAGVDGRLRLIDLETFVIEATWMPSDYLRNAKIESALEDEDLRGGDGEATAVTMLDISPDGQWLVSCDMEGVVHVYSLQGDVYHATLPQLPARMTCMRFVPSLKMSNALVCVTAENRFYIFDVEAARLTDWSRENHAATPASLVNCPLHVMGITFNPAKPLSFLMYGASFLCNVNLDKLPAKDANSSEATVEKSKRKRKAESEWCTMLHKYGPVLCAEYLTEGNLMVAERPWIQVMAQLGGAFYTKRYGK